MLSQHCYGHVKMNGAEVITYADGNTDDDDNNNNNNDDDDDDDDCET